MGEPGTPIEWAAMSFPLSSPFTMLAQAAQHEALWPHAVALAWQLAWVVVFIRLGAALFRKRVMKSGPQGAKKRSLWKSGGDEDGDRGCSRAARHLIVQHRFDVAELGSLP